MLPSDAPMPPWAATVCERVGNTLDSTATFRPASDSCSDARMPEPPAPTMTTSNLRLVILEVADEAPVWVWVMFSDSPQHLQGPAGAADQPGDGGDLQHEARGDGRHVIHQHVARAHPRGPDDGDDVDDGEHLHPLMREDAAPLLVAHLARHQALDDEHDGEQGHEHGGGALHQPVAHAIVGADDE